MAINVTPAQFKAKFTEFASLSDAEVQVALDEADCFIAEECWGDTRAEKGLQYLAAHFLSTVLSGNGAQCTPATPILRQKLLVEWEVEYQRSDIFAEEAFGGTGYGQMYINLRNLVFCCRCL